MSTLGGAGVGFAVGGPIGAGHRRRGRARSPGTAFAAKNYFGSKDKKNVSQGFDEGIGMTDSQLSKPGRLQATTPGRHGGSKGRVPAPSSAAGSTPSPADVAPSSPPPSTRPRAPGKFNNLGARPRPRELAELVTFFSGEEVFNDEQAVEQQVQGRAVRLQDPRQRGLAQVLRLGGRPVRLPAGQHQRIQEPDHVR